MGCVLSRGEQSVWRFEFNFQMLLWSYYYPKLAWAIENENAAINEALLSVVVVVVAAAAAAARVSAAAFQSPRQIE